ncbi:MAG: hypothetical protein F4Z60_12185 [Chloroflexi bacterium]|nr:hypothetical protein [Chloroflexota bacterium]
MSCWRRSAAKSFGIRPRPRPCGAAQLTCPGRSGPGSGSSSPRSGAFPGRGSAPAGRARRAPRTARPGRTAP